MRSGSAEEDPGQLKGKEPKLWEKMEGLILAKQSKSYDRAVEVLVDLWDLAARKDGTDYLRRVEALPTAHARKPTLIERLHKVCLWWTLVAIRSSPAKGASGSWAVEA